MRRGCAVQHILLSPVKWTPFLKLKPVKNIWRCSQRLAGLRGSQGITKGLKTAAGKPAAHIPAESHWHRAGNSTHMQITETLLSSKVQWEAWCWGTSLLTLPWWRQRNMGGSRGADVPTARVAPCACFGICCCFFQIWVSLLFSSLSPSDALLPSSFSFFFSPFEAQRSFPLLPSLFVSCLSYYSANTCKHWGTSSRFKLVPLSSPRTRLSFVYSLPLCSGLL